MFDLHSHILPGVDDGSETLEDSLKMLRQLHHAGFKHVFATPHVFESKQYLRKDTILSNLENLRQSLQPEHAGLELHPGAEHYIFPELPHWLREGKLLTLADTGKYLLLELPLMDIPAYTDNVFFELQVQGIQPILAHPERYRRIAAEPDILYDWLHKGVLFQVNIQSLSGRYGERIQDLAQTLLRCGLVHFLGSDAHRPSRRPTPYTSELQTIRGLLSPADWTRITEANPQAILDGRPIDGTAHTISPWPIKRNWTQRFLGLTALRQLIRA